MPALLEISAQEERKDVALAAAVQLGTLVEYHWKFMDPKQAEHISVHGFRYIVLSEADK